MSLVAWVSGNLLRFPFFSVWHRPPPCFVIENQRGTYRQEAPPPLRTGYLYLGILALANGEQEVVLRRYRLLSALKLKLYNQDLEALLKRLTQTRLHYQGTFFRAGTFGSRRQLHLLEVRQEAEGFRFRLPAWVAEDAYPIELALFRDFSAQAKRLYLYFTFALCRGPFRLSLAHLEEMLPVLSPSQRRLFSEKWPEFLGELQEAGVLEYEELAEGLLLIKPGPRKPPERRHPLRPTARRGNLLLLGRENAGKTKHLRHLRERAERLYGLTPLFLPGAFSLTDWLQLNFTPEEWRGLSAEEKRRKLRRAAEERLVLIDDLDRISGQKALILKECLERAPAFVVSAKIYKRIPENIRLLLERRGFEEKRLRSPATRDVTFALLAIVVILAALMGHHEWLLGLLAARFFLRQPL